MTTSRLCATLLCAVTLLFSTSAHSFSLPFSPAVPIHTLFGGNIALYATMKFAASSDREKLRDQLAKQVKDDLLHS